MQKGNPRPNPVVQPLLARQCAPVFQTANLSHVGALQQRFQVRSTKHNGQDGWVLVPVSYCQPISNQVLPTNITAVHSSTPKVSSGTISTPPAAQTLFHSPISASTGVRPPPQGVPIIFQSTNAPGTMLMPVSNASPVVNLAGSISRQVTPQTFIPMVGHPVSARSATNLASIPRLPSPMTIIRNPGQMLTNIQNQQVNPMFQVLNPSGQSDAQHFPLQQVVPSAITTMNTFAEAGSTKTSNSTVIAEPQPIYIFKNIADKTTVVSRPIASQCVKKQNPTTMATAQMARQNVLNAISVRMCNPPPNYDSNNSINNATNVHRINIDLSNVLNRIKSTNNASLAHTDVTPESKSTMHIPAIIRSSGTHVQKKMLNFFIQKPSKEIQNEDSKVTKDLLAAKNACGAPGLPSFSNQTHGIMDKVTASEQNQKKAVTIPGMSGACHVVVKSEPIDPEMPVLEKEVLLQTKEIGLKINSVYSLSQNYASKDNCQLKQQMIDGHVPSTSKEIVCQSGETLNEKEENSKINLDIAHLPNQNKPNDTALLSSAPVKFRINALRQRWLSNSSNQNRAPTNIADSVDNIACRAETPTRSRDNLCPHSVSHEHHHFLNTSSETPNVQMGETSDDNDDDVKNQHGVSFDNIRRSLKRKLSHKHDLAQHKQEKVPQKVQMSFKLKKIPDQKLDYVRHANNMSKFDCYAVMETLPLNGALQVKATPDAGGPCSKQCRERHLRNMAVSSGSKPGTRVSSSMVYTPPIIHPWMRPNAPRRRNYKLRWSCGGKIAMAYSNFKPIKMKPILNIVNNITIKSSSSDGIQSPVTKALLQRVSQNIKDSAAKHNASPVSTWGRRKYTAHVKRNKSGHPRYESNTITRYRAIQKKILEPRRPIVLPMNDVGVAKFIAPPQLYEELKVEDLPQEGVIYDACDKVFVANLGEQILLIPSYHDSLCKKAYKVDPKVYEHLKKDNRLPNVRDNVIKSNQIDKVATNMTNQVIDNSKRSRQSHETNRTHVSFPTDVIQHFRGMTGVKVSKTIEGAADSASVVSGGQRNSEVKGPLAYDTVTLDPVTGILNKQNVPESKEQKELFDSIRTLRLLLNEKIVALCQVRGESN